MSDQPEIRKVRPDEIEDVWRVHVASSTDLAARRGRPSARPATAVVAIERGGELAVFLASRPFGRPELYLPSGPILY